MKIFRVDTHIQFKLETEMNRPNSTAKHFSKTLRRKYALNTRLMSITVGREQK